MILNPAHSVFTMILDYAKKISRWRRYRQFNHRNRGRYAGLAIGAAIVLILLMGWSDVKLANYTQRMFRHEKLVYGIPIWRVDYPLPGHPPMTSQSGQWVTRSDDPLISLMTKRLLGQRTYAYFKEAISTLDGTSYLSANQKQSLEARIWAAAAAQQDVQLQAIYNDIMNLEEAMAPQIFPAPSSQPSIP